MPRYASPSGQTAVAPRPLAESRNDMSASSKPDSGDLSPVLGRLVDLMRHRFERAWQAGEHPRIEDFLAEPDAPARDAVLSKLIPLEVFYRRQGGEQPALEDYR